jgi:hypothetical protein
VTTGRRWKDNIKIDLEEIAFANVDWIQLSQKRNQRRDLGNMVMKFRVL